MCAARGTAIKDFIVDVAGVAQPHATHIQRLSRTQLRLLKKKPDRFVLEITKPC